MVPDMLSDFDRLSKKGSELYEICQRVGLLFDDDLEKYFSSNDMVKVICCVCSEPLSLRKRTIVGYVDSGFDHLKIPDCSINVAFEHWWVDASKFLDEYGEPSLKNISLFSEKHSIEYNFYEKLKFYKRYIDRLRSDQIERLSKFGSLERQKRTTISYDEKLLELRRALSNGDTVTISTFDWLRYLRKTYHETGVVNDDELMRLALDNVIGFRDAEKAKPTFTERCQEWVEHVNKAGNPTRSTNLSLFNWAADQRKRAKRGQVSSENIAMLERIGLLKQ